MTKRFKLLVLTAVLAVSLIAGAIAQQKSDDRAIDPVCGMTVVKAAAKATFEYKGTTYYFCNPGCKEAFAKDPEKYLQKQAAPKESPDVMKTMPPATAPHHMSAPEALQPEKMPMGPGGCPMMARRMPMKGHGHMMHRPMMARMGCRCGMMGEGPMAAGMPMACGPDCPLAGKDVELVLEKTKDGVMLKVTSKNAETVKTIQTHMQEHLDMMKKMSEASAAEGGCCPNCPMKKGDVKK